MTLAPTARPRLALPRLLAVPMAAALSLAGPAVTAAAQEAAPGGDNQAVAVNTEDGASVLRLALSVRMVANGVIDEANRAYALASCTDCQTVALAFQVVLAWGDVDVVVPENEAVAYNDQCVECLTYATAVQIVLGFDGPVRLTDEGRRRLAELSKSLRDLEDQLADMSVTELMAAVNAAKQEFVAILEEELVALPVPDDEPEATTTTVAPEVSTTSPDGSTTAARPTSTTAGSTSSTVGPEGTTTTTEATISTTAPIGSSTTTPPTTAAEAPTTTVAG